MALHLRFELRLFLFDGAVVVHKDESIHIVWILVALCALVTRAKVASGVVLGQLVLRRRLLLATALRL